MPTMTPGEWMDRAPYLAELDFSQFRMRVPTDRYHLPSTSIASTSDCGCGYGKSSGGSRSCRIPEIGRFTRSTINPSFWSAARMA